jgi:hypothetical protein
LPLLFPLPPLVFPLPLLLPLPPLPDAGAPPVSPDVSTRAVHATGAARRPIDTA